MEDGPLSAERICPNCGTVLTADAPSGLCTRCVLQQVIEESDAEGVPDEEPQSFHATGETPGRYTRQREHARGGMGRILIAHDEQLGRDIVIKELLPDCAHASQEAQLPSPFQRSSPAVTRFVREARVTGQLEHPAIVPVHELGRREDGTLYYTMKQIQGIRLSEAIRRADGFEERLELLPHFLDLCQAVSYAHSRGVIHRDIKPGNVMVGEFGETVLLDWGLAKVLGQEDLHGRFIERSVGALDPGKSTDATVTAFGQVLGTPVYMAPEQARAESEQVDERTDVYGLGALPRRTQRRGSG
jgi:serine/threonine protein kinase